MAMQDRAPLLYRFLHAVLPPMVNAVYRPWTEGLEHVPDSGPAILASNHMSFLDSVFLPAVLDRPVYFLGKSDYFTGWQRYFFENVGVMPVARQGGDAGEASLRKGQEILEGGECSASTRRAPARRTAGCTGARPGRHVSPCAPEPP